MCFTWAWLENVLIWIVIVGAICLILQLLLNYVLPKLPWLAGPAGLIASIVKVVIGAAIAIFVIIFAFEVISCLSSFGGGLHLPGSPVR